VKKQRLANPNPNTENLEKFKPGESGNPKGRPKGSLNLATRLKKWGELAMKDDDGLVKEVRKQFPEATEKVTLEMAMYFRMLMIATKSPDDRAALAAMREYFDRTEGKPLQKNEIAGPDGEAMKIIFKPANGQGD